MTMDTNGTFEAADREAEIALNAPVDEKSWGLFAQQAYPEPGLDERGRFLWFESRDALLDFMNRHLVRWISLGGGDVEDFSRICDEAAALAKKVSDGELGMADAVTELSDWLYEFNMEISWAGPFQELLAGPGEFPMEVRAWFRQLFDADVRRETRPEDTLPIRKEEADEFRKVLENYEEILE